MAAEYSANALQLIQPNGSAIFTASPFACNRGLIYHRDESGLFRLASPSVITGGNLRRCCCSRMPTANYVVGFSGNISVPTGGTAEEIQLALAIDGEIDPSSIMSFTPAAVNAAGNVAAQIVVAVPWICRCASVSVRNVSTQAIQLENANILFQYDGICR